MSVTITLAMLVDKGACLDQQEVFETLFGQSITFDTESLFVESARHHAAVFDWDWVATNLLRPPAWGEYDKAKAVARGEYDKAKAVARGEYDKAVVTARGEYDKAVVTARGEYDKAIVTAWDEYYKAVVTAWDEYYKAVVTARGEYNKALAPAWARAYWKQENA